MLHDFLVANRDKITDRVRRRTSERMDPKEVGSDLDTAIPLLLAQITEAMIPSPAGALRIVGTVDSTNRINAAAADHGRELLRSGFTVSQVVHGYGDVCQIVTGLAHEMKAEITARDFHVFNQCLDDAIAGAVTAYGGQRERTVARQGTENLGVLAHELRNLLHTAILSFDIIKKGVVGVRGSTAAMHSRSLAGLHALVERSLAEVRLASGAPKLERIVVAEFMGEIQSSARMQAEGSGLELHVNSVADDVLIDADWQLLASALLNLLQNAFKFTRARGKVTVTARATADRVLFEVFDECGGLPEGDPEELFRPFTQGNKDRPGLGLAIARNAVRVNAGELHVRNFPGSGCLFTIDLPRRAPGSPPILRAVPASGARASEAPGDGPGSGPQART
ncbi:MAG TPA: HAMP domain-containing sensor histidine kinase [Polyangiaceae bacterium]